MHVGRRVSCSKRKGSFFLVSIVAFCCSVNSCSSRGSAYDAGSVSLFASLAQCESTSVFVGERQRLRYLSFAARVCARACTRKGLSNVFRWGSPSFSALCFLQSQPSHLHPGKYHMNSILHTRNFLSDKEG